MSGWFIFAGHRVCDGEAQTVTKESWNRVTEGFESWLQSVNVSPLGNGSHTRGKALQPRNMCSRKMNLAAACEWLEGEMQRPLDASESTWGTETKTAVVQAGQRETEGTNQEVPVFSFNTHILIPKQNRNLYAIQPT